MHDLDIQTQPDSVIGHIENVGHWAAGPGPKASENLVGPVKN